MFRCGRSRRGTQRGRECFKHSTLFATSLRTQGCAVQTLKRNTGSRDIRLPCWPQQCVNVDLACSVMREEKSSVVLQPGSEPCRFTGHRQGSHCQASHRKHALLMRARKCLLEKAHLLVRTREGISVVDKHCYLM